MPFIAVSGKVGKAKAGSPVNSPCQHEGGSSKCEDIYFGTYAELPVQAVRCFIKDKNGAINSSKIDRAEKHHVFERYTHHPVSTANVGDEPMGSWHSYSVRLRSWNADEEISFRVEFLYDTFPSKIASFTREGGTSGGVAGIIKVFPNSPLIGVPEGSSITNPFIVFSEPADGHHWAKHPMGKDLGGWRAEFDIFHDAVHPTDVRWPKMYPAINLVISNPLPYDRRVYSGCDIELPSGFDPYEDKSINIPTNWQWGK